MRGVIANYCPLSYIFVVSAFWKRLIDQIKAGSLPDRLIPNTYIYIMLYVYIYI